MFFNEDDYTIKGKAQLKQNHFKAQKILVSSFLNIMLLCGEIFFFASMPNLEEHEGPVSSPLHVLHVFIFKYSHISALPYPDEYE